MGSMAEGLGLSGPEQDHSLLDVRPKTSDFYFLLCHFLICKMGIITVVTSCGIVRRIEYDNAPESFRPDSET